MLAIYCVNAVKWLSVPLNNPGVDFVEVFLKWLSVPYPFRLSAKRKHSLEQWTADGRSKSGWSNFTLFALRPSSISSDRSSSTSLSGSDSRVASSISSASLSSTAPCGSFCWCTFREALKKSACGGNSSVSNSLSNGTLCKRHSSRISMFTCYTQTQSTSIGDEIEYSEFMSLAVTLTWFKTWLFWPSVVLSIWTAFVMLVSSLSANHTGGVDGYVSCKSNNDIVTRLAYSVMSLRRKMGINSLSLFLCLFHLLR